MGNLHMGIQDLISYMEIFPICIRLVTEISLYVWASHKSQYAYGDYESCNLRMQMEISVIPICVPHVWPQLATPKLGELISQIPLVQWPYVLILLSSSLSELLNRIKNKVNCMGRSWDISSPNLGVGWMRDSFNFYLRILKFWWCHQWHVTSNLVNS